MSAVMYKSVRKRTGDLWSKLSKLLKRWIEGHRHRLKFVQLKAFRLKSFKLLNSQYNLIASNSPKYHQMRCSPDTLLHFDRRLKKGILYCISYTWNTAHKQCEINLNLWPNIKRKWFKFKMIEIIILNSSSIIRALFKNLLRKTDWTNTLV